MKNDLVKKIVPHIIAVLIFLIASLIFCKPALEGNVLNQHDIVGWKGMAQSAFDYKEQHGHFPLWNTHVFSGMPNYMIAMEGKSVLPDFNKILALGLPEPANFFFLAAICFYILGMALGLTPAVAIFGGLAYAFATYNPIIIAAGHITKMFAIAYMPLLMAGLICTYEKRYWLGLSLSTLGAYLLLGANHPQISYYFFLVAGFVTIAYLVNWIRNKEWKHIGIAAAITIVAAGAALLTTSLSLLTSTEYAKATIRGGTNVSIQGDEVKTHKTEGLDTAYAFEYSLGNGEELTLMMPNAFGGSTKTPPNENSHVIEKLTAKGVPESSAYQIASQLTPFWGDPSSSGGGPFYAGVIVCLLALLGVTLYKHPLRWGLLAVAIFAVLMAMGRYLPGFNLFLFKHLPLYSKFRSPTIAMVIPQLVLPILAVLALHVLFFRDKARELLKADFKKILYAFGGLTVLLLLIYVMMDYGSPMDAQIMSAKIGDGSSDELNRAIVAGLKQDRSALFGASLLRTIGFMALLLGVIWLYLKNTLKPIIAVSILVLVSFIEMAIVDKTYLNEENYRSKDELIAETATKTPIDDQILNDKDLHFRVFDAGYGRFNAGDYHAPTFHRTLGGYHPAKLRVYQDLIQRYLYGNDNRQVLNMLDAKYIIQTNPQTGQQSLITNTSAYGGAWLVKHVEIVKDDASELQSLANANLRDTAFVQDTFAKNVTQPQWDSTASIILSKYDNDAIEYTTSASTPQFAVFSEIYYPLGWNAYIDGNKAAYVKANYALRGMSVPAGKHTIRFVFEPATYSKGVTLSLIGSIAVLVLMLLGFFMTWKNSRKINVAKPK